MAEVIIVDSAEAAGEFAANVISSLVARKCDAVLGLATGSSPLAAYTALARRNLDLSRVRGFALDEYVGLDSTHAQSYRSVITREVVEPLCLTPALVRVPGDDGGPLEGAGDRYEHDIKTAGGIDLQVLGIGRSGHIGFNEPGSSFGSTTRVKTLTQETRRDNSRFFGSADEVPTHCLTQGIGTILRARHLVLFAFGQGKARAIASAVEGPLSASSPGSAIQLHPHVTVFVDEQAASELANCDYYRRAFDQRLDWERI